MPKQRRVKLSIETFRKANKRAGSEHPLHVFLDKQHPDDRKVILEAVRDPTINAAAISRTLKPLGYSFTVQSIRRHRQVDCARCGITGRG